VFVALVIQHAMHMYHSILSIVFCPAVTYSALSHKRKSFRGGRGVLLSVQGVFNFLYNLSEIFLNLKNIQPVTIVHVRKLSCKVLFTLARV